MIPARNLIIPAREPIIPTRELIIPARKPIIPTRELHPGIRIQF